MSVGLDFDQMIALRDAQQAQLQDQAPWVRTNPQSILTGIQGKTVKVSTQPVALAKLDGITTGPLAQCVNWKAPSVSETTSISVTLAPVQLASNLAQPTGLRPFALVQFGTNGFLAAMEVDIGQGTQFTISGSSIFVVVGLELIPYSPNTATEMQIAGMLSYSRIQKSNAITRTRYIDNIHLGQGLGIVIPPFAKTVQWLPNDIVTLPSNTTLTFHDSQTNVTHSAFIPANTICPEIPISDDDFTVDVSVPVIMPPSTKSGRLVFQLNA